MHPKPNGTQDPLREFVESLAAEDPEKVSRYHAVGAVLLAREALAAEPPEVEWEYRAVEDAPGQWRGEPLETAAAAEHMLRSISIDEGHVERRRKAGEWLRVDDRSDLDPLADALSTPGQQGDKR